MTWNSGGNRAIHLSFTLFLFSINTALLLPFLHQMCFSCNLTLSLQFEHVVSRVTALGTLSWTSLSTWAVLCTALASDRVKISTAWRETYIAPHWVYLSSAQFTSTQPLGPLIIPTNVRKKTENDEIRGKNLDVFSSNNTNTRSR